MSAQVVVVDYGIGNVFSVCNALKALGFEPQLTGDTGQIERADRVILPGVGAFARAMDALNSNGLTEAISNFVQTGRPFMGICIGMQVLMDRSTEFGETAGMGLISGDVLRIDASDTSDVRRRVPHIGWSSLAPGNHGSDWSGTALEPLAPGEDAVYFVHSYHCVPDDASERLAVADYDGLEITAAIARDNIVGVQFHPERSGEIGQSVLRAFLKL